MHGSVRRNWGTPLGLMLGVAIWSCTTPHSPSNPVTPHVEPAAPVTRAPHASAPVFFDAQTVLRRQLARGGNFYGWTVSDKGPACTDESFLDPTPDSAAVRFPPGERMYLHSGSFLGTGLAGQFHEFHGYSAVSVLDRGHELFFSLEDCRRHGMRYAPKRDDSPPKRLTNLGTHWLLPDEWRAALGRDSVTLARGKVELLYQLRFYFDAGLVYLRGPLASDATADPHPVARGIYRLTETPDHFEIGGWRFCSTELEGEARARCLDKAPAHIGPPLYPIDDDDTESPVVDFAEEFWKHSAPLYVPVFDDSGEKSEVSCQELTRQTSSYGLPEYRVLSEGIEQTIALVRTPAGFDPFLAPDAPGSVLHTKLSGSEPELVVHGRDARAFWINGTPWFFRQEDCRSQSKPVNFGLSERASRQQPPSTAPPSPDDQPVVLGSEYYMLEWQNPAEECLRTTLTPLVTPMGRLVVERPGESIAYNYDYYPVARAFWLTRVGAYPTDSIDPLADLWLWVGPHYAGITVGEAVWYETEPQCAMGLQGRAIGH